MFFTLFFVLNSTKIIPTLDFGAEVFITLRVSDPVYITTPQAVPKQKNSDNHL